MQWIALITVIFSLIGFFHAKYFYAEFGIDVANYFSLSDYLAVSVTKIYAVFITILGMSFWAFLGFYTGKKQKVNNIDLNNVPNVASRRIREILIFILLILLTLFAYLLDNEFFYYGVGWIIWIVAIEISDSLVKKYSISNTYYFLSIGILTYIVIFISTLFADIHKFKNVTAQSSMIYLDNNQSNSYTILGANSTYVFLYDRNQSKSFVYPTEKLEHIEIQNLPESNATRVAIMSFVKSGKDYIASFGNEKDMNVSK